MEEYRIIIAMIFLLPAAAEDLMILEISGKMLFAASGAAVLAVLGGGEITELFTGLIPGMLMLPFRRKGIGEGDIICGFILGELAGWEDGLAALFYAAMLSLIYLKTGKKKKKAAFVPWMTAGLYLQWFLRSMKV